MLVLNKFNVKNKEKKTNLQTIFILHNKIIMNKKLKLMKIKLILTNF